MSVLRRKLRRDLRRLAGQVATIALVLACGIMTTVTLRGAFDSLVARRDAYYAASRFAHVFARVERAPLAVADELARIPGVAAVDARVVEDVLVPLAGEPDAITGRVVSLPDEGRPPLDDLHVRAGRLPAPGAADEAVILAQFAAAHGLRAGDRLPAVIDGRLRELAIVGVAASPEYVLAISGRELLPDNRRFVVLWMRRAAIAPAFQLDGAFDDVALGVVAGTSIPAVIDAVDRVLAPYGGVHAIPRARQLSHAGLDSELASLRTLGLVVPLIFLGVAAFLVHVVVSRLVFLERTQIAVLEALGFTGRQIVLHYLALVAVIAVLGAALGVAAGAWLARALTDLYAELYELPARRYELPAGVVALALAIGPGAAFAGALGAVRRAARLPPAEAMRPPAPPTYRRSWLERVPLARALGPGAIMVLRELARRPLRFAMSTLGIAASVAIVVTGRFATDAFDHLLRDAFVREHRADLTVAFAQPRPERAVRELEHVPGVRLAEGQRVVPVRLRVAGRARDTAITGLPEPSTLRRLLDHGRPRELPAEGLVLTDKLAELLGTRVGELVDVDRLDGDWASYRLPIAGVLAEPFGLQAYARAGWLDDVLGEEPRISAALLAVERGRDLEVRAALARLPEVIAVSSTARVIRRYRDQTGGSLLAMTAVLTISAAAIAVGIVYNNARVALSMRGRDLASLRVLGFTRAEISGILLGELGAQLAAGVPLGLALGTWWAGALAGMVDPEAFRLPLYIADRTYAGAAAVALVAGLLSALLVRRKLDHLDLVGVLKAPE